VVRFTLQGLKPRIYRPFDVAAEEVAEKVLSFVGRAFRHGIISALSSGVLTPEGLKAHFSATTEAATHNAYIGDCS
jgi:hypothetical protein